jgi:hypothetical protein
MSWYGRTDGITSAILLWVLVQRGHLVFARWGRRADVFVAPHAGRDRFQESPVY